MNWHQHITSDKAILGGKPIIKGTRLPVEHIQARLADCWTNDMLLESFPTLKPEHIQAVRELTRTNNDRAHEGDHLHR